MHCQAAGVAIDHLMMEAGEIRLYAANLGARVLIRVGE
jgi:hypothetical protein